MPVFVYQENAFERMKAVEGQDWAERQESGEFDPHSFKCFRARFEQMKHEDSNIIDIRPRFLVEVGDDRILTATIYGHAGYSRYHVYNTGEICYIDVMVPNSEWRRRVEEQGFSKW